MYFVVLLSVLYVIASLSVPFSYVFVIVLLYLDSRLTCDFDLLMKSSISYTQGSCGSGVELV